MIRRALAWVAVGLLAAVGAPLLFAGDPAPLSAEDQAKVKRLVEDLGSDDFRIREAATKALIEYGDRVRPALEEAVKSEDPAVRFRADQILQRLDGPGRAEPLEEPSEGPGAPPKDRGLGDDARRQMEEAWKRFFDPAQMEKWRAEFEERMKELEAEMQKRWGTGGLTMPMLPWPGSHGGDRLRLVPRATRRDLHLKVDGGDTWAELFEGPRGARIVFTEKKEPANTTTHTGKSVAAILESNPKILDWPGAKELVDRYEQAKKEREGQRKKALEAEDATTTGRLKSVQIESSDGHARVTITESGPDGKPVTKTYEGADLEALKRDHPELREALGGMTLRIEGGPGVRIVGPMGPGGLPGGPGGPRPLREDGDDDAEDGDEDETAPVPPAVVETAPATGPFGLALSAVTDPLRGHLGLEAGAGALVIAVRAGSPAAAIGLQANDVVTAVNAQPVKSLGQVSATIRATPKDAPLSFEVRRGGKTLVLKR